jgi:hypothetical protein
MWATKVHALERKVSVHECKFAELADSMAELLAAPPIPPEQPIGFINSEDKGSKKVQARRKGELPPTHTVMRARSASNASITPP